MCTHPELVVRCRNTHRGCSSILYRDRHAVQGHLCRTARERGGHWGLCKTGVEWSRYDRVSPGEECAACELAGAAAGLTAETCDEAAAENVPCGSWVRGEDEDGDGDGDGDGEAEGRMGEEMVEGRQERDGGKEGGDGDEDGDDEDDEDGGVSVVVVDDVADDDEEEEEEEEGGVRLGQ